MEPRTAGAIIGVLALCCLAFVLAAVYPGTTAEPHAAAPAEERFTVGDADADAYRASGRIVVDGEKRLAFDGVVTADGARYHSLQEAGVRSEQYQASPNATVYERLEIDDAADAERLKNQILETEDRRLLSEESTTERVSLVVASNGTDVADEIPGSASVIVRSLHVTRYERVDGNSTETAVYEPQNGWYEGTQPYRITDASGTVRTDAGTAAVESASVSWAVTDPAGSYAEYLLARLTGPDPRVYEISYEFVPGDSNLDRPAWVDDARDES
ncbi:hypothetical protein HWV23_05940 [Natronomonas halophila]|uniref:hypothetical protein n=1 Tax=Natronomonas halophila TaxID=2747817 RepID=UPI0015B646E7|nr:hypothetical protein [Natronomonas halophila]QLD85286.1 hypothetical protein HWV23_05940 [Natronomonas halophila]